MSAGRKNSVLNIRTISTKAQTCFGRGSAQLTKQILHGAVADDQLADAVAQTLLSGMNGKAEKAAEICCGNHLIQNRPFTFDADRTGFRLDKNQAALLRLLYCFIGSAFADIELCGQLPHRDFRPLRELLNEGNDKITFNRNKTYTSLKK